MKTLILVFTFLLAFCTSVNVYAVNTVTPVTQGISVLGTDVLDQDEKPKKRKRKKKKKGGTDIVKLFRTLFFISGGLALAGLITMILGLVSVANTGNEGGAIAFYVGYLCLLAFGSLTSLMGLLWVIFYFVENS